MLSNFFDDIDLTDLTGTVAVPAIADARVNIHQGPSAAISIRMIFPSSLPWEIYGLISSSFACAVSNEVDLDDATATMHNVCHLLSYAADVPVQLARVVVEDGNAVGPWLLRLVSHKAPGHPSLPVIPLDHEYEGSAKVLLEQCVDRLDAVRDLYHLQAMMNLARLARRESTVEVKGLIVANAFEVLRYHYGHRVLVPAGRAIACDDDLLWPPGSAKVNARMSFAEILDEFARDHSLTHWESTRFKVFRNTVVHTGKVPGATLLDKYKEAIDALHFLDTAILALLDWDKAGGKYVPCNQPSDPRPDVWGNNLKFFSR